MKARHLFLLLFIIPLLLSSLIFPAISAAAPVDTIVTPFSIKNTQGSVSGTVASLAVQDQSGTDDTPSAYVLFKTPGKKYIGFRLFSLPAEIRAKLVSSAVLHVNFKGPAATQQVWTWSIYNWKAGRWIRLGNSSTATADSWNTLSFPIANIVPYVNGTNKVRIRIASSNARADAKLDYEALHITYEPATATPTRTPTRTATPLPAAMPAIALTAFKDGFDKPLYLTHANDGSDRIFVVERCGTVKIIDSGGTVLSTPFLSLPTSGPFTCSDNEQGLLSIVFPPNYASKNYFYAAYTLDDLSLQVSRFHVPAGTPNDADETDVDPIINIPHPNGANHNGGQLAFGSDGYLYISTGDGGGGGDPNNNAQNKSVRLGKILRIDVEGGTTPYGIPSSNPFVGATGDDLIWSYGLRNPWRFSFDRLTHDLYIADVGQGAWEEVNFRPASSTGGENYGWRIREGNHCYPAGTTGCGTPTAYVAPVAEYSHSLGCSVTGGYVYRGSEFKDLQGIYLYGDYCSGRIWGLRRLNGQWQNQQLLDSPHNISSFGEDEDGNLYLTNISTGAIHKIVVPGAGVAPSIAGCQLFPANNIWNARVDTLPVHARSAKWIESIGNTVGFHMDFGSGIWPPTTGGPIGIPYNVVAGSSVTHYTVDFYYGEQSDEGPYPIPDDPAIEHGSDHHILVVDTEDCTLYETYDMSFDDVAWSGGSGAIWSLNSNALRPDTWTSADAAGLPILPGLVRYEEVANGYINHALRFTAESTNSYIWPARHLTSGSPGVLTNVPPMGARFRLKASYNISGFDPEMQVILRAMQQYGIILADNGSDWYVSGAPSESWDNDLLHTLDVLKGSDFEAVDTSSLMVDPDSFEAAAP